jgi:hypothetical protein
LYLWPFALSWLSVNWKIGASALATRSNDGFS